MTFVCGVDGFKRGWVVALEQPGGGEVRLAQYPTVAALIDELGAPAVLAIDIPIGLPVRGSRQCDVEARRLLGPKRGTSVFPAPRRAMLYATSYTAACEAGRRTGDGAISKQAWALMPKLREVDELLQGRPELRDRVKEVHPEVCFFHLAGGHPVTEAKRTFLGLKRRLDLLEPHFASVATGALEDAARLGCGEDDALDALAALWTARRIASREAVRIPVAEERDATELVMEMWA